MSCLSRIRLRPLSSTVLLQKLLQKTSNEGQEYSLLVYQRWHAFLVGAE